MAPQPTIRNEFLNIIRRPTVLMCKSGAPIEYANSKGVRKIKLRQLNALSPQMIHYVASQGGAKIDVEKFSSGDFNQYLQLHNLYG